MGIGPCTNTLKANTGPYLQQPRAFQPTAGGDRWHAHGCGWPAPDDSHGADRARILEGHSGLVGDIRLTDAGIDLILKLSTLTYMSAPRPARVGRRVAGGRGAYEANRSRSLAVTRLPDRESVARS
jgi:hypothetical protein